MRNTRTRQLCTHLKSWHSQIHRQYHRGILYEALARPQEKCTPRHIHTPARTNHTQHLQGQEGLLFRRCTLVTVKHHRPMSPAKVSAHILHAADTSKT